MILQYQQPNGIPAWMYLMDVKLNPDVRDTECSAFEFGRRSVDPTYSLTSTLIDSSLVYGLEDI